MEVVLPTAHPEQRNPKQIFTKKHVIPFIHGTSYRGAESPKVWSFWQHFLSPFTHVHLEQQNPNKTWSFWKTRSCFIGVSFIVSCCVAQLLILPVRCSSSYKALREQDFNHTAEEGKARYLFFYSGQEHNSELQSPRSHSIFSKSWRGKRGKRLLSCNSWHWFPLLCNLPLPSSLSTTLSCSKRLNVDET